MAQARTHSSADTSRLVRVLTELTGADPGASQRPFAERLGQLYDLPESIRIAAVHSRRLRSADQSTGRPRQAVRDEFLRAREALVRTVIRRFGTSTGSARLRFPAAPAEADTPDAVLAAPYTAFYTAQQRDIDARVRNLQATIREEVAGISPQLARLAALDAAMGDPLAVHGRRFFGAVPSLLQQRIQALLAQYQAAAGEAEHQASRWEDTLALLRRDMQNLLLAEIEIRLLPTLGLIEALTEQDDS